MFWTDANVPVEIISLNSPCTFLHLFESISNIPCISDRYNLTFNFHILHGTMLTDFNYSIFFLHHCASTEKVPSEQSDYVI